MTGDCQSLLADRMRSVAALRAGTAAPFKFVINTGDNFYPSGVYGVDDAVWDSEWGDVYKGLPHMRWYGTYGNHDYGQGDRSCACATGDDAGARCLQVQKHGAVHGDQEWYLPAMSFYANPLPGISLEIVSLDLNILDSDPTCPWVACGKKQCGAHDSILPGCNLARCRQTLQKRAELAFELLEERISVATRERRQLIVLSHYPSSWLYFFHKGRKITELLRTPQVRIAYFSGHVHCTQPPRLRSNRMQLACSALAHES